MIKKGRSGQAREVRVTFVLPADEPAGAVSVVGDDVPAPRKGARSGQRMICHGTRAGDRV
jgi:hypothetical protein